MKATTYKVGRAQCLALFGRWERGELTDEQLLRAVRVLQVQERLQEGAVAQELDRQLEEVERC
jgi:hypothetical protein